LADRLWRHARCTPLEDVYMCTPFFTSRLCGSLNPCICAIALSIFHPRALIHRGIYWRRIIFFGKRCNLGVLSRPMSHCYQGIFLGFSGPVHPKRQKETKSMHLLVDTSDPLDPVCCVKSPHFDLLSRPHGRSRPTTAMMKLA
jgi:hypothetical protein